jgi:hypothetical protein
MRLEPSRRLAVSLGLSLGAVLPIAAAAVSTLTGESLTGSSTSPSNSQICPATYTVSGTATGPYPGSFTETGTLLGPTGLLTANYTITSASTTVTGSKTALDLTHASCGPNLHGNYQGTASYTATIHTPSGNYHDEGTSTVTLTIIGTTATLTETFASSLTQPTLIVPTSKDQCKDNGWQNYPQFKNQGQCVSFLEHQGH